ncbi:hypothetical protein CAEBREN_30988 [Caenorhabditis brenneri]|uniref:RNA-directed DNA polymerase n=1 Tax=Caenorhabditis brenneri TaxID=135651 RepID=G0PJ67_CAEBE|nr:hypothetical protein CAEBREN_30988 [Caenorhabditis brenneri]
MTMSFRAGKLESFDGSANMHFSDWLRSFTDHINVSNQDAVEDSTKISLLMTYLKDSARERASEVLSGMKEENPTFEAVTNKLKETFERKAYKQKAREELSCAKQTSREDVESFYYRVLRLVKIAHGDANSDVAKDAFRDAFINGLPSKSKMLVFAKDPETAQDALDVAIRLANFEDSPTKKSLESAKKHDRAFGGGDRTHRPFTGAPNREFHPSVQMNYPSRGQSRFNPSYRNNNGSRGGYNNPRGGYNNYRGGGNGGGHRPNLNQTMPAQTGKACYHCGFPGHILRYCYSRWGAEEAQRRMRVANETPMGLPKDGQSSGSYRGRGRDSHNQTFQPSSNHQQRPPQVQVIQSGSAESTYQELQAENEALRARNNEMIQQRFGATHHYGAQVIEVSPKRISGNRPVINNVDHDEEYISLQIPIKVNKLMFAALVDTGASITVASDKALKTVLDGMDHEVMLYIDDVLIFSKTFNEHLDTLERVLQRFRQYNLKVSPKKCDLVRKSIVFLGHQINEENYEPNKSNVSAIVNMPTPSNINELRRFIGMTGFFRRFVKDYSEIVQPLNKLTHKNTPFVWTKIHQDAVQKLKTILTSKPVLCYPDYNKEFHCYTDASGVAQGAVLMQTKPGDESKMQAIAYASRTLSQPETRRAAIHNELGAIIFALRTFKIYIYGNKVVVHTDHRPLIFLMKRHKVNDVLARWLVELQQYDVDIVHIDGKRNTIADYLSRPPDDGKPLADKDLEDIVEFPYCLAIQGINRLFRPRGKNTVVDLITEQRMDKELSVLRKFLEDPSNDSIKVPTKFRDITDRLELTSQGLVVVQYNGSRRILVPEKIKTMLFDSFHGNMSSGGHLCWRKSLEKAQRKYFWPGMRGDFLEWTNQCLPCQRRKSLAPANRELQAVVCTTAVFEKVGLDLTGPLRESTRGNRYYLNIVCWFSKFVISVAIPDATTETVSRAFVEQCILKYGTPAEIITDNARNFTSGDFKDIGEQMGFKHHFSIPHHSRGNGATERTFRTFHNMVSKYVNKTHTDWDSVLPCVTSAYNTAVHSTTGESPFFLVYGRDPVFPIDRLLNKEIVDVDEVNPETWKEHLLTTLTHAWKTAAEQSKHSQLQYQEFANRGAKVKDIRIGDRVLIRNYDSKVKQSRKLVHNWLDGYRVTAVRGTEAEVTSIRDPKKVKRMHFNQIKHQYSSKEEEKMRDLRRDAPTKEDSEEDFEESEEDNLVKSPVNKEAESDLEEDISFVQRSNNTSKDKDELLVKRLTANKEEEKKLTNSLEDNKKRLTKKGREKNNQINDPDQLTKKKINKMNSKKKNEEKEKKDKKKKEIVNKKNEDKKEKGTNKLSNKEEFSQGATTRRYPARMHNKPAKYTQ